MRLSRLQLAGYKSFANKTEFAFGEGITAIIGPNGSGKSNIADALRWALGEQSQSALRAKRTEDLIFAGSDGRSRLGMAEVVVTLDNADGTLPIDFTEVTITRRAYRSGETEYLMNGARVRLRDVLDLLAHSDLSRSNYAVVGQGLVDQALALRPDERRLLIDEAAGLRPYQAKRETTLGRLDETEDNLHRVQDILAEIGPRVQRLQRYAERAYEYNRLSDQLKEALTVWYGYQWHRTQAEATRAEERAARLAAEVARTRDDFAALQADLAALRAESDRRRGQVGTWRREASGLRTRYEEMRRSLAVGRERLTLLTAQRDELRVELEALGEEWSAARAALDEEESTLSRLAGAVAERGVEAEARRRELAALEARRKAVRAALAAAQSRVVDLAVRVADRQSRAGQAGERRAALASEIEGLEATAGRAQADVDAAQAALARLTRLGEASAARVAEAAEAARAHRAELGTVAGEEARLEETLRRSERALQALASRREVLVDLRRGLGEAGGAGEVMARKLPGWRPVGRVAELIRTPPELDRAVEAALGSWLHALVVESWDDARRALAVVERSGGGRLSVLPLDSLRVPPDTEQPAGCVAGEVGCDARFRPLVAALLGDVALVDDLAAARMSAPGGGPRYRYVSRDGGLLDASGGLIAGEAGGDLALAREREWRSLPAKIEAATGERDRAVGALTTAQARRRTLGAELGRLEKAVADRQGEQRQHQAELDATQRALEKRERELGWQQELLIRRRSEMAGVAGQAKELEQELRQLEASRAAAEADSAARQAEANALSDFELVQAAAEAQAALSGLQREQSSQQARVKVQREALDRLERQSSARRRRFDELERELVELDGRIAAWASQEETLREEVSQVETRVAPAEEALDGIAGREREMESAANQARTRTLAAESAHTAALSEVQRHAERLAQLRSEIRADLDLVAPGREAPASQLALDLPGERGRLPEVTSLPEGLERQVQELRRQMRSLGPVDPALLAEYETARERATFLGGQLEDLTKASNDLRQIIVELDRAMARRFDETFEQVAALFASNFTELFGGGSARLVKVESGRMTTNGEKGGQAKPGIDIVARPPGKRSQPLSLLSGGERALSAVALIFALLEVSRTPFCLLDEVDAMLDEANIGRFRDALERLAERSQIIVITHNRGTVQAASTLYGVSMNEQAVSQVISLKLNGDS